MKSKISSFFEKNVGKLALSGIVFALALVVALTTVFVFNGKKLENKTTPPTNAETTIVPNNSDNWIDPGNYDTVNVATGDGFSGGDGSEADPYIISTARQLAGLSYLASRGGTTTYKYYKLGNDIDLLNHYWTPIGTNDTYYFNGSFDGNGYVISGMVIDINSSLTGYAGLFGCMKGESGQILKISNLGIENSEINVTRSSSAFAGGLVGYFYSPSLTIRNSYNTGSVNATGSSAFAGGLVGQCTSTLTITNSYNAGNVSAIASSSYAFAGGIVGRPALFSITIINVSNVGSVSATSSFRSYVGGLMGEAYSSSLTITNSYNAGSVSTESIDEAYACGLVGRCDSTITIANSYNSGTIDASGKTVYKGGLIGAYFASSGIRIIKNSYYDGDVFSGKMVGNGTATITASGKVSGLSEKMRDKTNYGVSSFGTYTDDNSLTGDAVWTEAWDFQKTWMIEQGFNFEYPIFKTMRDKMWKYDDNVLAITGFSKGLGTAESPYQISSAEELAYLSNEVNSGRFYNPETKETQYIYVELTADIDLSGKYWTPIIGNLNLSDGSGSGFVGSFDGKGYVISGMTVDVKSSQIAIAGFFGYMAGATDETLKISNLGVINSEVSASSSYSALAGGLVGYSPSLTIENCYNTGSVSASGYGPDAGGLVGCSSFLTIENCYNTGNVSAESSSSFVSAGGLVGDVFSSLTITNSYNTGSVSATSSPSYAHVGGLVGHSGSIIIESSFNSGKVSTNNSSANVGGIVGYINGSATINNTFCTGDIQSPSGSGDYINPMVGRGTATITNSYYNLDMLNSSGGIASTQKNYYDKGSSDPVAFDGNIWFYHADLNEGLPLLRPLFWAETSIARQSDVLNIFTNKGFNLVV